MRQITNIFRLFCVAFISLCLLNIVACSKEATLIEDDVTLTINAGSEVSSDIDNVSGPETRTYIFNWDKYHRVCWSGTDALDVYQIGQDNFVRRTTHMIQRKVASGASTNDKGEYPNTLATFQVKLPVVGGTARYWVRSVNTAATDKYWEKVRDGGNQILASLPLVISSKQVPEASTFDKACDILLSNSLSESNQAGAGSAIGKSGLKRPVAFAKIVMTGIPKDHSLKSLVFKTDGNIVGTRHYDVLNGKFNGGVSDVLGKEITVDLSKVGTIAYQSGTERNVWLTLWPSEISSYEIELETVGSDKKTYTWYRKVNRQSPIKFVAAGISSWKVKMELKQEVGNESFSVVKSSDAAKNVFRCLYAGDDMRPANEKTGFDFLNNWSTHYVGNSGVAIHEADLGQYASKDHKQYVRQHIWIAEIDPAKASLAVGSYEDMNNYIPTKDTLQYVELQAEAARRQGKKVLAAVNGDAWGQHCYGVMYKDGKAMKEKSSTPPPHGNCDVLYVNQSGRVDIVDNTTFERMDKSDIQHAIGGWFRLICFGNDAYASTPNGTGAPFLRSATNLTGNDYNLIKKQSPRTFMGIADDRIYVVVADGRRKASTVGQTWAVGLTMNDCARICKALGCNKAINLDGGGSTTMVKYTGSGNDMVLLNKPSDGINQPNPNRGGQRLVINSLLIVAR